MRALQRLVAILEAVAHDGAPASMTLVADRVGLSLSTTARLMRELEQEGLLERDAAGGAFSLGSRLLALARNAIQPSDLLDAALPVMRELRHLTNETVSLHIRRQHLRVCVAEVESTLQVRRVIPVGFTVPLKNGATSEVLIAGFGPGELANWLEATGLSRKQCRELELRLREIRRDGWALSVDTVEPGLAGIAASVHDGSRIVAALSVSGPSARWTVSVMRSLTEDVVGAANRISQQIEGHAANNRYDESSLPT